jgi:hypothetical protein
MFKVETMHAHPPTLVRARLLDIRWTPTARIYPR